MSGKCYGGCSFWDCGRPKGHPGPCQPTYPFEQFQSPQEKLEEEDRELHNDGYCKGAPDCFLCQEEKEEAEEIERSKKRPDLLKSFHEAMEWAGLMPKGVKETDRLKDDLTIGAGPRTLMRRRMGER